MKEFKQSFTHPEYGYSTWIIKYDEKSGDIIESNLIHHEPNFTSKELDSISAFHG